MNQTSVRDSKSSADGSEEKRPDSYNSLSNKIKKRSIGGNPVTYFEKSERYLKSFASNNSGSKNSRKIKEKGKTIGHLQFSNTMDGANRLSSNGSYSSSGNNQTQKMQ